MNFNVSPIGAERGADMYYEFSEKRRDVACLGAKTPGLSAKPYGLKSLARRASLLSRRLQPLALSHESRRSQREPEPAQQILLRRLQPLANAVFCARADV